MEAYAQGRRACGLLAALAACGPEEPERTRGPDIDAAGDPSEISGTVDPGNLCYSHPPCLVGPTTPGRRIASAADIAALDGVRCVFGGLHVESPSLVDLTGLEHIEVVCGGLLVENNAALTDTRGLDAEIRGSIEVRDNPKLARLSLPTVVDATLTIEDNPALLDLAGLDALTHGVFYVRRNAALTTFGPFPALISAGVVSEDNPALLDLAAPALTQLEYFYSRRDHALVELHLPALTDVDRVDLSESDGFAALDLPALRSMRSLKLSANPSLTDFPGLPTTATLDFVELTANPALVGITGLLPLTDLGFLWVLHNPALDQAHAEAVAAALGVPAKIAGNAGWVPPAVCPFEADGWCDAIGCGEYEVCAEGSDELDCCECLDLECPLPPGGGS